MKKYQKKDDANVKTSKALSWLLRHGAVQEGLVMNADGFLKMDDVLEYFHKKGQKLTIEKIMEIVETNDKKRFEVKKDIDRDTEDKVLWIRATQGHSIKEVETDKLLEKIEDPTEFPVVVHGTYKKFWEPILNEGLKRMTRLHIHFAPGYPKDKGVISGMRSSCDILIEIDMAAAMKDGIQFFLSSNNVILTEGIEGVLPPKYFKKAVVLTDGKLLLGNE